MFKAHFENHNAGIITFFLRSSTGSSRTVRIHWIGQRSWLDELNTDNIEIAE